MTTLTTPSALSVVGGEAVFACRVLSSIRPLTDRPTSDNSFWTRERRQKTTATGANRQVKSEFSTKPPLTTSYKGWGFDPPGHTTSSGRTRTRRKFMHLQTGTFTREEEDSFSLHSLPAGGPGGAG